MKRFIRIAVAITMVAGASPASAQQKPSVADAARQDAVVKQALSSYQQGLDDLKAPDSGLIQPGTSSELA
jgi:hypothetical protein